VTSKAGAPAAPGRRSNAPGNPPPPSDTPTGAIPTGSLPLNDQAARRLKKIAEAAYRRAQQRNFAPGNELDDWLQAEREVDAASADMQIKSKASQENR